jgi:hypothetical protein
MNNFGVNDVILDWRIIRGAEAPFDCLASIDDLLCLFSLAEAVAIYDLLWVSENDIPYFDALKPLVDNDVIVSSSAIPDKLTNNSLKPQFDRILYLL